MLSFSQPWLLLLLLLVPLVLYRWLHRPRPALRYPDVGLVASLPGGRSEFVHRLSAGVRTVVLVLLIVGLAGPRWPDQRTRIPTEGIAIAMLVDVSGSMAEQDFDWDGEKKSRIEAAKTAFALFVAGGKGPAEVTLPGRPGDLVSLVVFANRPDTVCPLTLSHGVVVTELDKQEPRSIPGESETNIADAIIEGLARLQSAGTKRKVIVLLSDGEHNVTPTRSKCTPSEAAEIAASLGVPIYVIDAGSEAPSKLEGPAGDRFRTSGLATLREVARIANGECFPAHDAASLLEVCRKIDRLERVRIESYHYRLYSEGFPWLGLAAFVLLVGMTALEMTVWQKYP